MDSGSPPPKAASLQLASNGAECDSLIPPHPSLGNLASPPPPWRSRTWGGVCHLRTAFLLHWERRALSRERPLTKALLSLWCQPAQLPVLSALWSAGCKGVLILLSGRSPPSSSGLIGDPGLPRAGNLGLPSGPGKEGSLLALLVQGDSPFLPAEGAVGLLASHVG